MMSKLSARDGKYAIVSHLINRGDNNLYVVNLSDGKEALLTPHEGRNTCCSLTRDMAGAKRQIAFTRPWQLSDFSKLT